MQIVIVMFCPTDVGNRITELTKVVGRLHTDVKLVTQCLVDAGHTAGDGSGKEGSSVLGKYIMGAKNNFRGFTSRPEDKLTPPLQVTVHRGGEGAVASKQDQETEEGGDGSVEVNQQLDVEKSEMVGRDGAEGSKQAVDSDVVKMEEGRAKDAERRIEGKENDVPEETMGNGDTEVKEERATEKRRIDKRVTFEEKVDGEAAEERKKAERLRGEGLESSAEDNHIGKVSEKGGGNNANTIGRGANEGEVDIADVNEVERNMISMELKGKNAGEINMEARWTKGRKMEDNATEKAGVGENAAKPGAMTLDGDVVPSPTGSSSSQDTGFGSQEGEGSID